MLRISVGNPPKHVRAVTDPQKTRTSHENVSLTAFSAVSFERQGTAIFLEGNGDSRVENLRRRL